MCLKEHQPPLDVEEQIENLKSLGLVIEDEDSAKAFLNDVSYFRFVKAYSLGLKPKNGKYQDGTTFHMQKNCIYSTVTSDNFCFLLLNGWKSIFVVD